jgi:6-phosphogluconolactonase (cycloisomerase 2 family)
MGKKLFNSVLLALSPRHALATVALALACLLLTVIPDAAGGASGPIFVYVGSYTTAQHGGGSLNPMGLSVFQFDPATGALSQIQQVRSANPSFVVLDPSLRFLYVTNEIADYEGQTSGSIEAYAIDPTTGMIKLLNRQSLNSPIPSQVAVDPTGHHLVVSNYIGGDFVVLPIEADGRIGPVSGRIKNSLSAPPKGRQEAPHPHGVVFDPAGRFIAAPDLGIDKVQIYRLTDGGLALVSEASLPAGTGPRHVAFDLSGKHLYVVNELNATVTVFANDATTGKIGKELQSISTVPKDYKGKAAAQEVAVHPSGKFLYASTRDYHSIVGYRIDPSTGLLSVIGFATQGLSSPRNFVFDPSGKWLYALNQTGDTIVQFEINPETGQLTPTGRITPCITPVVMAFRTAN